MEGSDGASDSRLEFIVTENHIYARRRHTCWAYDGRF